MRERRKICLKCKREIDIEDVVCPYCFAVIKYLEDMEKGDGK